MILVEKTMERDCGLGQGAARFVKDRLVICSDDYKMWVCNICGLPAHIENAGQIRECRLCGVGSDQISKIRIPYGTKIVNQELAAMNIVPRIMTTPFNDEFEDE
jgi:DNA-directed RNA polymerase II subunit RPB2